MTTVVSDQSTDRDRCRLCDTPIDGADAVTASTAADEESFCSSGCRDVAAALGTLETSATPDSSSAAGTTTASDEESDALARTFFRIDGMHSALCEAYLEAVARNCTGVADAAASYVTDAVRVDHDPDRVSAADLEEALTTTGYTAYRRTEATADDDATGAGGATDESATRRSREMQGLRKRRSEDVLELRYVVGIVFGSFLLVPYVTVFYPVYAAGYTDYWLFDLYGETFASFDGVLFLPLFFTLTGAVLYLAGMPLLRGAYVSLKLRRPSTHLLATLSIVAAYAYGTLSFFAGRPDVYYDLTILVAAVVMAAVFYEERVKRRALNRLTDLTVSQVDRARVLEPDGSTTERPIEDVSSDDRLLVRAGERVPVDGTLAEGTCTVDEAVVTGESLPIAKAEGDPIVGGSVVTGDAAVVAVGECTDSSIESLTRTVWDLQSATHAVQRRADALAGALVPVVVGVGVAVGVASVLVGVGAMDAASAVLLAVIVASPWTLAFATPISIAASVRDALERGIVVFDETVFERLRDVDVVVFDKTGTLTTGEMTVREADAPAELLRAGAAIERRASHPAAAAIADAFAGDGLESASAATDGGAVGDGATDEPPVGPIEDFERHATGVEAVVDGRRVLVGHPDLFGRKGWTLEPDLADRVDDVRARGHLPVVLGREGRAEGLVVVGDEPRPDWAATLGTLAAGGVDVVVLTGDDDAAATRFREHPAVSQVFAGVPPAGKTAAIRRLREDGRVAMVGDGTNDAPALTAADLGVSLGGGTALAADAADLAIVEDDLAAVERAFALARAARRRVVQNLGLALSYNALVIPAALAGLLSPLVTTAALAASVVLIAANASRDLLDGDRS